MGNSGIRLAECLDSSACAQAIASVDKALWVVRTDNAGLEIQWKVILYRVYEARPFYQNVETSLDFKGFFYDKRQLTGKIIVGAGYDRRAMQARQYRAMRSTPAQAR